MQLVDEQDDVSRPAHLRQDVAELLLKLPPVFGPRHHGRQVQSAHPPPQQVGGHRPVGDGQGQPLRHGGLAHPRLPQQDGVIFAPPGQDLDDPLQLRLPADHRVQLPLGGHGRQIPGALVQLPGVPRTGLWLPGAEPGGCLLAPQ